MMSWLAIPTLTHLLLGFWVAWKLRASRATPHRSAAAADGIHAASPRPHTNPVCLVAARNESANIDACLEALAWQEPPLDVILIDDHSIDDTHDRALAWMDRFDGRLAVLRGGPGKAAALEAALTAVSPGRTVLTTDADCRPPPGWAQALAAQLEEANLGALGGSTMVRHDGPVSRMEALDWAILLASVSALSSWGRPITAMGNNMALDPQALVEAGGFMRGAGSVTEDYVLFRAIGQRRPTAVMMEPELLNWTEPLRSLRGLFRQRRRWAIGAADGSLGNLAILLFSVPAFAAPWVFLAMGSALGPILLAGRWAMLLSVAQSVERRLGISLPLGWIPLYDAVASVYSAVIPLTVALTRRTVWKERVVS